MQNTKENIWLSELLIFSFKGSHFRFKGGIRPRKFDFVNIFVQNFTPRDEGFFHPGKAVKEVLTRD